jgi:Protein of unknown function DUF262
VQAQTLAPAGIFGYHIRYVVPLFQRPYVWNLDDQWEPLWEDVRTVTERLLDAPAGYGAASVPPHFLGAIVLDQQFIPAGFITVRHVVDGQQRLTTLQLLLDAAQYVVEQHGATMDAQALRVLVLNDPQIAQHPDEVFKVWPTDRDQAAFRSVMDNDATVPPALRSSRIAQAHAFFVEQISEWAEVNGDQNKVTARLNALVRTLREHLKVVVIDLEPGDNAQVIFETLNHRGSPLLAADLVKNLVFQLAHAQDADVEKLYRDHWAPLDNDYWRQPVAQGRLFRPRIDVFLNYWLTMKLRREVQTDRVYSDFRDHVLTAQPPIPELLAELAADTKVYEQMDKLPAATVEGTFYYRVIKALDSAAVGPFLLWVLRWDDMTMPAAQRQRALRALESRIVRRALCRATAKDVNRTVVELLRAMDEAGPAAAGDTVEAVLAGQQAESRYWPDAATLHAGLREEAIYKSLSRRLERLALLAPARAAPAAGQAGPRVHHRAGAISRGLESAIVSFCYRRGITPMPNEPAKDSIPQSVAAFITYKRYLQHLELALTKTYGTEPALGRGVGEAVNSLPAVRHISRRRLEPKLRDAVARELGMAWNEEISIRVLSEIDPTKLPWLLPNAAVNSYYAIYHVARAWIAGSRQPQPDTHTKVLHALADAAEQRHLFPPPWDLVCTGYPTAREAQFGGLPKAVIVGPLHGWQRAHSDETLHTSLCMLLRTTRARTFEKRKADWRKRNKKAGVPAAIAHELAETLPPTTFFDYLWRLRVRSDYRDIDALIPGGTTALSCSRHPAGADHDRERHAGTVRGVDRALLGT